MTYPPLEADAIPCLADGRCGGKFVVAMWIDAEGLSPKRAPTSPRTVS